MERMGVHNASQTGARYGREENLPNNRDVLLEDARKAALLLSSHFLTHPFLQFVLLGLTGVHPFF